MLNSYKTIPIWSGRILHVPGQSEKYLPRGQDHSSVSESNKEQGQKKAKCCWHNPVHACVNRHSPLPLTLLYLTSSNRGSDPIAWQAPSQDRCLLPWLWDVQSCISQFDIDKTSPYLSQSLKSPLLWLGSAKKAMQAAKASEPHDSFRSECSCSKTWNCDEMRSPGRLQ